MDFDALREVMQKTYGPDFDHGLVERAYRFAEEVHSGQFRKSGDPYITHPLAVALRLAEWKLDTSTIAAALLHDTTEDSTYTRRDIEKHFGREISSLVAAVSKLKNIRYTDAAERQAENLRQMVVAFAEDIRAVLIKLMDRLHNMETVSALDNESQKHIARETLEIYAPLANRFGMGEIKGQLEDLAFPVAFPEEYSWLVAQVKEPLEERKKFIERLIPHLKELLGREGITPLDIHARAKHWYSLWRKFERYDRNLEHIYDLVAVRIVVDTVEQCYTTLGAIHGEWPPLPGRIKDYIALPKPNSYRSLHTTVFGPEGKITEIQIRTAAMHREAEGGIAAHWAYGERKYGKVGGKPSQLKRSRDLSWVNQLREWRDVRPEDLNEFLRSLQFDFFKDRIFVFTPKGEVINLPEGATPVDFAYHVHSDIGDRAVGAKVNGKMTALDVELKNGDIVEIATQKNKKPSAHWLEFVKTAEARKHIRSALRR